MQQPNFMSELNNRVGGTRGGFTQQPTYGGQNNARIASGRVRQTSVHAPPGAGGGGGKWADIEFYYMDLEDNQIGPASVKELRVKWKQQAITEDCFYW